MASEYRTDSQYRNTGIVNNKYLDIYESGIDVENIDTYEFLISSKYENRPDVLAHDLYGNAKLWWVLAEFNPDTLGDPIIDFLAGLTINVPTRFS